MGRFLVAPAVPFILFMMGSSIGYAQFDDPPHDPLADPRGVREAASPALQRPPEKSIAFLLGEQALQLIKEDPVDDKIRSLKKKRCIAAYQETEGRLAEFRAGRSPIGNVLKSSRRLATSLLSLEPDDTTRIAILESSVKAAEVVEDFAQRNMLSGIGTKHDVNQAKYERLTAEILLEEARAELKVDHE